MKNLAKLLTVITIGVSTMCSTMAFADEIDQENQLGKVEASHQDYKENKVKEMKQKISIMDKKQIDIANTEANSKGRLSALGQMINMAQKSLINALSAKTDKEFSDNVNEFNSTYKDYLVLEKN